MLRSRADSHTVAHADGKADVAHADVPADAEPDAHADRGADDEAAEPSSFDNALADRASDLPPHADA